jgi:hypothetical protein
MFMRHEQRNGPAIDVLQAFDAHHALLFRFGAKRGGKTMNDTELNELLNSWKTPLVPPLLRERLLAAIPAEETVRPKKLFPHWRLIVAGRPSRPSSFCWQIRPRFQRGSARRRTLSTRRSCCGLAHRSVRIAGSMSPIRLIQARRPQE